MNLRHSRRTISPVIDRSIALRTRPRIVANNNSGTRTNGVSASEGRVICADCETRAKFGHALDSHHKLRYRTFIEQRYWSGIRSFRGREYDEYDTLAAHYLIWVSPGNVARGCLRVAPTDRPYMLKDHWPRMCARRGLPESMSTWEMTRLCVDQALTKDFRTQIANALRIALFEFGLRNDIQAVVAVMHPKVWTSFFAETGLDIEFLGPEMVLGDEVAQAGRVSISVAALKQIRAAHEMPPVPRLVPV